MFRITLAQSSRSLSYKIGLPYELTKTTDLFSRRNFIFRGAAKKANYEGCLDGERLIPIQAITCVIYTCGALVGSMLFLDGYFTEALLLTIFLTQLWRIASEILRADFCVFGKISAYQNQQVGMSMGNAFRHTSGTRGVEHNMPNPRLALVADAWELPEIRAIAS